MPLFHYTDLNAVVSILKTKKLWLTDLRYLNDKTEFYHGVERLLDGMKSASNGLFCDWDKAPRAVEIIKSELKAAGGNGLDHNPLYICSLSKAENLLSQWRGYGQYAIEFNEKVLINEIHGIRECIYDPLIQTRTSPGVITDAITAISKSIDENGSMGEKGYDVISELLKQAATFKDDGFAEEREFRIIREADDEVVTQYRVRNNLLIPYIELPISLDCVKAIHIGPMNERSLAEKALQGFCSKIEREWQIESANIEYWLEVKTSAIPYRSI